jgi:hypothetical protein
MDKQERIERMADAIAAVMIAKAHERDWVTSEEMDLIADESHDCAIDYIQAVDRAEASPAAVTVREIAKVFPTEGS